MKPIINNVNHQHMKSGILKCLLFLIFILSGNYLQAQLMQISGTVTSKEDGQALPGVNITISGSTQGSISDLNGNYKLEAKKGDNLKFTYLGYKVREIIIGDVSEINVSMEAEEKAIDEVVVIGYGTKKKSEIVGSVSLLKSDEILSEPSSNLQGLLTGKVAGMYVSVESARPGGSSNISIRGVNSLKGSTEPLYVIDGIPVTSVNEINVDDVESISVLKDASSQAIYGARASNGVILITTKKRKRFKRQDKCDL